MHALYQSHVPTSHTNITNTSTHDQPWFTPSSLEPGKPPFDVDEGETIRFFVGGVVKAADATPCAGIAYGLTFGRANLNGHEWMGWLVMEKNNAKKATAPFHFPKNWATSPGFGVWKRGSLISSFSYTCKGASECRMHEGSINFPAYHTTPPGFQSSPPDMFWVGGL